MKHPTQMRFRRRLLLTIALLFLSVPWWPGTDGSIGGLPAWAALAMLGCVVYAAIVAWLLESRWDDGSDDPQAP